MLYVILSPKLKNTAKQTNKRYRNAV